MKNEPQAIVKIIDHPQFEELMPSVSDFLTRSRSFRNQPVQLLELQTKMARFLIGNLSLDGAGVGSSEFGQAEGSLDQYGPNEQGQVSTLSLQKKGHAALDYRPDFRIPFHWSTFLVWVLGSGNRHPKRKVLTIPLIDVPCQSRQTLGMRQVDRMIGTRTRETALIRSQFDPIPFQQTS